MLPIDLSDLQLPALLLQSEGWPLLVSSAPKQTVASAAESALSGGHTVRKPLHCHRSWQW